MVGQAAGVAVPLLEAANAVLRTVAPAIEAASETGSLPALPFTPRPAPAALVTTETAKSAPRKKASSRKATSRKASSAKSASRKTSSKKSVKKGRK
jgi:predicted DNA-binding transcriptional regulator YafY